MSADSANYNRYSTAPYSFQPPALSDSYFLNSLRVPTYEPTYERHTPRTMSYEIPRSGPNTSSAGGMPTARYAYATPSDSRPLPPPFPSFHQNELPPIPGHPQTSPPDLLRRPSPGYFVSSSPGIPLWPDQEPYAPRHAGYQCASCSSFTASTREELARHQQRKHNKIHHCRVQGCSRTEGFATPNDRERHEKSKHKIPGDYWQCLDQSCSSYQKIFSRRDNLKDHIRRMHPLPEGISDSEASVWRNRLADMWLYRTDGAGDMRQ